MMESKERARRSAAVMWKDDAASRWLGMQLLEVDEGYAVLSLQVQQQHANGLGICHGGITFALADSAFAFACNSRNQSTVAQHNSISYTKPAMLGDTLTAVATEISLNGRNGITDVIVKNQDEDTIAIFRGVSRAIKGHLFDEEHST